jgi:hypothetical protein
MEKRKSKKSLVITRQDASDTPIAKTEPTVKQRIIIAWLNYASIQALVPSQKKYKEAQLAFVANLADKMGKQFPQDVLDCAIAKKDITTLLRSSDATKA